MARNTCFKKSGVSNDIKKLCYTRKLAQKFHQRRLYRQKCCPVNCMLEVVNNGAYRSIILSKFIWDQPERVLVARGGELDLALPLKQLIY